MSRHDLAHYHAHLKTVTATKSRPDVLEPRRRRSRLGLVAVALGAIGAWLAASSYLASGSAGEIRSCAEAVPALLDSGVYFECVGEDGNINRYSGGCRYYGDTVRGAFSGIDCDL